MQLFEKPKIFFCILFPFLESILHLEYFEKNGPPSLSISEVIDPKKTSKENARKVLYLKTLR